MAITLNATNNTIGLGATTISTSSYNLSAMGDTTITNGGPGLPGQGINLSGSQYINGGNSGWTNSQKYCGVTFWMYLASVPSSGQHEVIGNCGGAHGFGVFFSGSTLYCIYSVASFNIQVQFNTTFSPNTWYHITVAKTIVTGAGQIRVWVNGVYDNQGSVTDANTMGTDGGSILIGYAGFGGLDTAALIDEVYVFRNLAISDANVVTDYNNGSGTYHTAATDALVYHLDGTLDGGSIVGGSASYSTGLVNLPPTSPGLYDTLQYSGTKWINYRGQMLSTTSTPTFAGLTINGNATLGNASTQTFTHVGRMVVRTLSADPTANATAGTVGEIAYYNNKFYGKITGSGTDTNWAALN